jgi:hypothetical protein
MVVRFVCVVCVPLCVRVFRVSSDSCVSRLPPVSFYRVHLTHVDLTWLELTRS